MPINSRAAFGDGGGQLGLVDFDRNQVMSVGVAYLLTELPLAEDGIIGDGIERTSTVKLRQQDAAWPSSNKRRGMLFCNTHHPDRRNASLTASILPGGGRVQSDLPPLSVGDG
jgi:hypothetical protein